MTKKQNGEGLKSSNFTLGKQGEKKTFAMRRTQVLGGPLVCRRLKEGKNEMMALIGLLDLIGLIGPHDSMSLSSLP